MWNQWHFLNSFIKFFRFSEVFTKLCEYEFAESEQNILHIINLVLMLMFMNPKP
jgi:hypothetical protein